MTVPYGSMILTKRCNVESLIVQRTSAEGNGAGAGAPMNVSRPRKKHAAELGGGKQ